MKIVYVKWYFYVKFNGFVVYDSAFLNLFLQYILLIFQVVEIIGGGGGWQNDMFATPPPPHIRNKVPFCDFRTYWTTKFWFKAK